ncbi:MAG TPA: carboxymuconolactone decarboxylase family protein, partial [Pseudonocardiaceae bacterium]|nr:carboxymuconolactone decarboxylase family protein [Pseudonocardiaceae bacterium]
YLDAADLDEADRHLLARPINLFRGLANSPDGLDRFHAVGEWIRHESSVDARLRELAILQIGYLTRSRYEYAHHIEIGRHFGVSDDDIRQVRTDRPLPAGPTGTVLRAARELTLDQDLTDATWQAMVDSVGVRQSVELVLVIAFYNAVIRVLAALAIDLEPDYQHYLDEFPLDQEGTP